MADEEFPAPEARNYVMARLAACRAALSSAAESVDMAVSLFVDPSDDNVAGKMRADLLEDIDDDIGAAARAVQAAQELFELVDMAEGEEDLPEDDGHDEDTGEDDGDDE